MTVNPPRRPIKKSPATDTAPPTEPPVAVVTDPPVDPDGILPPTGPTLAEAAGYRAAIAPLEPKKKELVGADAAQLAELYAFGALDSTNPAWVRDAGALVTGLGEAPEGKRAALAAALAAHTEGATEQVKAWAAGQKDARASWLLGHALRREGDRPGARKAFEEAARLDPTLISARVQAAQEALRAGDIEPARTALEALYQEAPGTPAVNLSLAGLALSEGRTSRAERLVGQVLALEEGRAGPADRSAALVLQARLSLARDARPDALKQLEQAVRAEPHNLEAINLLSEIHVRDRAWDKALEQFELVAAGGADSPEITREIVRCLEALGRKDRAQEVLLAGVEKFPDSAMLLTVLGDRQLAVGEFEKARQSYEKALGVGPNYMTVHLRFARLLERQTKVGEALQYLEATIAKHPRAAELYSGLGELRLRIAQVGGNAAEPLAQAREVFEKALALDPSQVETRRLLAVVMLAQDKAGEALAQLELLAARPDFHGDIEVELGRAKQALGRLEEAIKHYEKALANNPDDAQVLLSAGIARFTQENDKPKTEKKDLASARDLLSRAHAQDQKLHEALYYLGRVDLVEGGYEAAAQEFKRAIEEDKKNLLYHYWLGVSLEEQGIAGTVREARTEYDLVIEGLKADPRQAAKVCDVYVRRGGMRNYIPSEWNGAKADLEKARACGAGNARYYFNLGNVAENASLPDEALRHYQEAITRDPDFAPAHLAAARVSLNLGRSQAQAISWLERAVALNDAKAGPIRDSERQLLADPHYLLCTLYKESNKAKTRQHCEKYKEIAGPKAGFAREVDEILRGLK